VKLSPHVTSDRPLKNKYQEVAKSLFMESSAVTPGGVNKRKQQAELEEKVNALYSNIKLFEKSVKLIAGTGCVLIVLGVAFSIILKFLFNFFKTTRAN